MQLHALHFVIAQFAIADTCLPGLLGHENLAPGAYQYILDLLIIAELLHPERTHQHCLDTLFLHYRSKIVLKGIYRHPHQAHILDALFMSDETTEFKLGRLLGTDALCNTDSTRDSTVDQYSFCLPVSTGNIEEGFYHNTHYPHKESSHSNGSDGLKRREGTQHFYPLPAGNQRNCKRQHHCHKIGIGQLDKINETAIADNTGIGLENPGTHPAQNSIQCRRYEKNVPVLKGEPGPVVYPICEYAGNKNNKGVSNEDAPVRQYSFTEIPTGKFPYPVKSI